MFTASSKYQDPFSSWRRPNCLRSYAPPHRAIAPTKARDNLNDDARRMSRLGHRAGIIHGRLSNTQVPLLGGSNCKVGQSGDRRKGLFKAESFSSFN